LGEEKRAQSGQMFGGSGKIGEQVDFYLIHFANFANFRPLLNNTSRREL